MADDPYGEKKINYWRTTNQTEIDFIVSRGADLNAFETKWQRAKNPKSFASFKKHYPDALMKVVTRDEFIRQT